MINHYTQIFGSMIIYSSLYSLYGLKSIDSTKFLGLGRSNIQTIILQQLSQNQEKFVFPLGSLLTTCMDNKVGNSSKSGL